MRFLNSSRPVRRRRRLGRLRHAAAADRRLGADARGRRELPAVRLGAHEAPQDRHAGRLDRQHRADGPKPPAASSAEAIRAAVLLENAEHPQADAFAETYASAARRQVLQG
jgi:hypothetical protein